MTPLSRQTSLQIENNDMPSPPFFVGTLSSSPKSEYDVDSPSSRKFPTGPAYLTLMAFQKSIDKR
jgi:hypothetical protein